MSSSPNEPDTRQDTGGTGNNIPALDTALPIFMIVSYLVIVAVVIVIAGAWYTSRRQIVSPQQVEKMPQDAVVAIQDPTTTPTPTPTPTLLLQGTETYTVSQSQPDVPNVSRVVMDPHDPKPGESQTVRVITGETQSIRSMRVIVQQDNTKETYQMELVEGTSTNGTWERTWEIDDTHLYTYILTLEITGESSDTTVDIAIRKP